MTVARNITFEKIGSRRHSCHREHFIETDSTIDWHLRELDSSGELYFTMQALGILKKYFRVRQFEIVMMLDFGSCLLKRKTLNLNRIDRRQSDCSVHHAVANLNTNCIYCLC